MDPGVMEEVVDNRLGWGQITLEGEYEGYVALLDCKHLDDIVWVEMPGGERFRAKVADCAAAGHRQMLEDRGWVVELSWPLALKYGVVNNVVGGVTVSFLPEIPDPPGAY